MKYKVLIKKCVEGDRAARVAEEIARWSGSTVDVVKGVIVQKPVCIKKEAEYDEAMKLKQQFERVGAEVELVAIGSVAAAGAAAPPAARRNDVGGGDDDDEDDDYSGRVLSDSEFSAVCAGRKDIFTIETDRKLNYIEIICLVLGVFIGIWFTNTKPFSVTTDFFDKTPEERAGKFVTGMVVDATLEDKKKAEEKQKEMEKKEELQSEKKKLQASKAKGMGGQRGGGGDPRARVTRQGVLGIISGQVKGKSVASADIFGKGGFASNIDAVLAGVGGLKGGGGGGVGRKGVAGIGYGVGYGSGFGGGGGGVDDLLGSLMNDGSSGLGLGSGTMKKRGELKVSAPTFTKGGALTGGRSRESIMRVVMQNIAALRYAYNKRLREKPGLKGTITVKFAIDEFGKVIFCEMVKSTMADEDLENTVTDKIKRWVFDKIDKPGDVTEVIYPFSFSQ